MPRITPKALTAGFDQDDINLALTATFAAATAGALVPAAVPAVVTGALVLTGNVVVAVKVLDIVTAITERILNIIKLADDIGIIDITEDGTDKIAKHLEFEDSEGEKYSVARLLHLMAVYKTTEDGEPFETNFSAQMEAIVRDLQWVLPSGERIGLGTALGSLLHESVASLSRRPAGSEQ